MPRSIAVAMTGLLVLSFAHRAIAAQTCPPSGWTQTSLQQLKQAGLASLPDGQATTAAMDLIACLDHPDPGVRDGIAYESLSVWMRKNPPSPQALRAIRTKLYGQLDAADAQGFGRPFAALVLAEVARTDRIAGWMTPTERIDMVERAATHLEGISDYRGFQAGEGWRHGVAHGADWLMQLSLNPALDNVQRQRLLDAVASQVAPDHHSYVFGEPARLAAPVLLLARAGLHDEAGWQAWLEQLAARLDTTEASWNDAGWLSRRHDLRAFVMELYVSAAMSDHAEVRTLLPGADAVLRAMP